MNLYELFEVPEPEPLSLPPIFLWRSVFHITESVLNSSENRAKHASLSSRERSELMMRELILNCKDFVKTDIYRKLMARCVSVHAANHPGEPYGELAFFQAMAAVDPDEFIEAVRQEFPDDICPVERLDPFLIEEGGV